MQEYNDDIQQYHDWFASLWEEVQRKDEKEAGHELPVINYRLPLPEDFNE